MKCCVAVLLGLLLGGCIIGSSSERDPSDHPIQTDQLRYEARPLNAAGLAGVEVTIPMEFTNVTAETVYLIGCRRPTMPRLEKWQDEAWVPVWGALELQCLSPPWPVEPGEVFRDTLHLQGYWPDQNAGPTFDADVPGRYRLVREVHTAPEPLAPLTPEATRTSNPFELVWADGAGRR